MNQKNAIVTGASGGIGSAIALRLAQAGYRLVLMGNRSAHHLKKLQQKCEACHTSVYIVKGDLAVPDAARTAMEEAVALLGSVDLLVNCAGISHIGLLTDMTDEEWMRMIQTNLSSVFYCCRAVIPGMVHEKSGHILNISSVWGSTGASCEVAYSAAKGGLNTFTKALAKELAPSGIAVNALACGMIDTPMNHCFNEEEIQAICEEIPAGRMGSPKEAAEAVLLLANAPVYLTGQIVTMDGGWFC